MSTKINDISLEDSLMFIWMQKIYFTLPFFYEILQRYYKFATLVTFGMPGYEHWKR